MLYLLPTANADVTTAASDVGTKPAELLQRSVECGGRVVAGLELPRGAVVEELAIHLQQQVEKGSHLY